MASSWDAAARLKAAPDLPSLFELVKDVVRRHLRRERSGLMLGLSNLGGGTQQLVGGFFQVAGNMIVMNTMPLVRIQETQPDLYKPYAFHIMLHEYLHAIGFLDEAAAREMVREISDAFFGPEHVVTRLAHGWGPFMQNLVYPVTGWTPAGGFSVEVVRGFDRGSTDYIQ